MPIFISVEKVVLLVCIKSALIMSFPAPTINETPLNNLHICKLLVAPYLTELTLRQLIHFQLKTEKNIDEDNLP